MSDEKEREYPWASTVDEQRRAFALECYTQCGDAHEIDGTAFVQNLAYIEAWLRDGSIPKAKKAGTVTQLKTT